MLDYLERERGIKREILIEAVSNALLSASKKSVGASRDLRIDIDPKTGEIRALANLLVVEKVTNPAGRNLARQSAQDQARRAGRRSSRSGSDAEEFRPHRRADRQAGDDAAHPPGREGDDLRGVQGSRRRDRERHGAPLRSLGCDPRSRKIRSDHAAARTRGGRGLQRRRSAARLRRRGRERHSRPGDHRLAQPSEFRSPPVRTGSERNRRRHRRDPRHRARSRLPHQDRGLSANEKSIRSAPASACAVRG